MTFADRRVYYTILGRQCNNAILPSVTWAVVPLMHACTLFHHSMHVLHGQVSIDKDSGHAYSFSSCANAQNMSVMTVLMHAFLTTLQEEIRCLQQEFNTQFAKLRQLKHQELERLNDKCKRVEAIQKVCMVYGLETVPI
jgi:hypothetical protein